MSALVYETDTGPDEGDVADRASIERLGTDFGVFYPRGWIVTALPDADVARRLIGELRAGGYADDELAQAGPETVFEAAGRVLSRIGLIGRIGASIDFVETHRELARTGAAFVLVRAASDRESARVQRVLVRHAPLGAWRYHTFAIETLRPAG